jgi:hypothetical protein
MRQPLLLTLLAGVSLALADTAGADVVVRLKSGSQLYASHTWKENGLVKFEHRGGIVGFPESAVESVTDADVQAPIVRAAYPRKADLKAQEAAATEEAAGDAVEQPAASETEQAATARASDAAPQSGDAAQANAAAIVEPVPEVEHEDLQTRSERLDDLLLKSHRELSVARSRGDPPEVVQALEAKIDEINKQRAATQKAIGSIH